MEKRSERGEAGEKLREGEKTRDERGRGEGKDGGKRKGREGERGKVMG